MTNTLDVVIGYSELDFIWASRYSLYLTCHYFVMRYAKHLYIQQEIQYNSIMKFYYEKSPLWRYCGASSAKQYQNVEQNSELFQKPGGL